MGDWPTEISHLQVPVLAEGSDATSSGNATPLPGTPKAPPPAQPPPVTKPRFLELSDGILYGDENHHAESQPPSALGLDSLLPRLNWIGSMSEPTRTEDGRELSTAEIYERNQRLLDESIPDVPLVSDLLPMEALRAEYENGSAAFRSQIDWLISQGYTGIRRARGDGDCFYRSLAFAYIERLLQSPPDEIDVNVASSLSILQATRQTILLSGTDEFILEDPYEMITTIIQNIVSPNSKGNTLTPEKLLARFQDQVSDSMDAEEEPVAAYIVYYLRMITSAHIKNNAADYEPFFEDGISARDFCSRQVDPVGIEADHIQMGALCKELKVNLKVAYLDGHQSDKVDFVAFDEGPSGGEPITLLYRPGHYDILAKGNRH